jgi:hypothetical protein
LGDKEEMKAQVPTSDDEIIQVLTMDEAAVARTRKLMTMPI